jgi:hypothetical protein
MPHADITSDPSHALHPTVNKQNTPYRHFQYFASADCLCLQTLTEAAQQHSTHSCNFKIDSKSHQCHTVVIMALRPMKLRLHAFFIFSVNGDKGSVSGSKETTNSNDTQL